MSAKAVLIFCAQALLVKSAMSQCIAAPGLAAPFAYDGLTGWAGRGLAYDGLAAPLAYDGLGGWAGRGLAYDGLAAPLAYDGLGGCAGRGLAYDGLAAPLAYDGLAGWAGRGLAYDGLAAPLAYDGLGGWAGRGLAYDGIYPGVAPAIDFTPTSGGGLPVSSASAFAPVGISVASENVYEGALAVAGELPFVGTVGLEGVLPTAGMGAVNHACGNGINAMVSETTAFAPEYFGASIAPGLGYRAGWAGRGCGCAL